MIAGSFSPGKKSGMLTILRYAGNLWLDAAETAPAAIISAVFSVYSRILTAFLHL